MIDTNVLDIDITIGNVGYSNSIKEDLEINKDDLDSEFLNQSEKFAYYGTLSELAKDKLARRKRELDLLEAQIDGEVRIQASNIKAADPKVKITVDAIKAAIVGDPRYQAKISEILDSQKMAGILNVAKEAFQQRKDMLVSLGANSRLFNNASPHITSTQMQVAKEMLQKKTT